MAQINWRSCDWWSEAPDEPCEEEKFVQHKRLAGTLAPPALINFGHFLFLRASADFFEIVRAILKKW